ncbi:GGDEF domain-containing protein [Alteromonas facilis]|uniref:GGDEF domain-containing protein n=1 Tax=Alteromonas facilis TaxID=2048004 RepID=UPI000C28C83E|nr:GGDEF domain-containing protein [Alteromonas facilis]
MSKKLLDSMVALTRSRDIDSLEASLLVTLIDLIECESIVLYEFECQEGICKRAIRRLFISKQAEKSPVLEGNEVVAKSTISQLSLVCASDGLVVDEHEKTIDYWLEQEISDSKKVCVKVTTQSKLSKNNLSLITAFLKVYANYAMIIALSEQDKLTGLLNRHSLERRFQSLIKEQLACKQSKYETDEDEQRVPVDTHALWLGVIDIDHFKQVNDVYGHLCGDEVLLKMSQLMREWFRKSDLLFRFGGEEFLVLLQPIETKNAERVFDDFRHWISQQAFPLVGQVTISVGITAVKPNEFINSVVSRADQALYFAKEQGRNKVAVYEHLLRSGVFNDKSQAEGDIDLF